ncbi:unnamed protein product [Chilo suppressalis]|uniref:Caspase-4 n=1 Tax=Chilo suppressalis TaxID=168631 RepID=A0ABN8B9C1_CHISP|nr:unnamed protein product [Chilo suppressalis]
MEDINKNIEETLNIKNEKDSILKKQGCASETCSSPSEEKAQNEEKQESLQGTADAPAAIQKTKNRALPKTANTYELENFEKKYMLILNHREFIGCIPRPGTEKDVDALDKTFKKFGFEVIVKNDLTYREIMDTLTKIFKQDFTDYGCIVVAVLTHGAQQGLIRAKDMEYNEFEIIKHFNVDVRPTLVTKPKILIVQACRGQGNNDSVTVFGQRGPTQRNLDGKEALQPYTLPVESDMLILHSSYMGKVSFSDSLNGSWFIQSLCCMINKLATTHDLQSIMVEVNRLVAIELFDNEHDTTKQEPELLKQMPVITSTLIRKLYLRAYRDDTTEIVPDITPPLTPPSIQCHCHVKHFNYIRDQLKYYIDEHQDDNEAQLLYDMVKIFGDSHEFNDVKKQMLQVISNYLNGPNVRQYKFRKFVFFYKL